jgi:50S ribosomal subunit-associated GTPase HflX
MFCRGTEPCLFIADLSRPDSIEHLTRWQGHLMNADCNQPIVLALNKMDLLQNPDLSLFEEQLSRYNAMILMSAKTSYNIDFLFMTLAKLGLDGYQTKSIAEGKAIENTSSGCCEGVSS